MNKLIFVFIDLMLTQYIEGLEPEGVSVILGKISSIYQNKGLDELYLVVSKRRIRNQPVLNKATKQQRPNTKV